MKKGWMFLLLISLGLNLGLASRLVRPGQEAALPGPGGGAGGGPRWERPAPGDTTAWRQFMGRRVDHLAERLELSPEQVVHFRETHRATGQAMRLKRREVSQARKMLGELMAAETIDRPAVRRAMAEMGRRQVAMDSLAAETLLGELDILDPDQRVRYLDFLPEGPSRHSGRGRRGRDLKGQ